MRHKISMSLFVLFAACLIFSFGCNKGNDPMQGYEYTSIVIYYQQDVPDSNSILDAGGHFQDPDYTDAHKPFGNYVDAVRADGLWRVIAPMERYGAPGSAKSVVINSVWVNGNGPEHTAVVTSLPGTGRITKIEPGPGYSVSISGSGPSVSFRIYKAG